MKRCHSALITLLALVVVITVVTIRRKDSNPELEPPF